MAAIRNYVLVAATNVCARFAFAIGQRACKRPSAQMMIEVFVNRADENGIDDDIECSFPLSKRWQLHLQALAEMLELMG